MSLKGAGSQSSPSADLLSRAASAGLTGETGLPQEGHSRVGGRRPLELGQQLNVTRGTRGLPVGRGPESQASPSPLDTGEAHSQAEGECAMLLFFLH